MVLQGGCSRAAGHTANCPAAASAAWGHQLGKSVLLMLEMGVAEGNKCTRTGVSFVAHLNYPGKKKRV